MSRPIGIVRWLLLVLFAASMLVTHTACAAAPASEPARDEWHASVLTFGPGPLIFERYGHIAIRLYNPSAGIDVCYDWGNFSFDDPNFIARFIKGDLRYWMQGKRTYDLLEGYIEGQDRTVTEQVLNLTATQNLRLRMLIAEQDDEEHRYYFYDYFKDNCATRVRDVLNDATGGALHERAAATQTPHSYRWHNRRLAAVGAENVIITTLMDLPFGPRADAPLTRWDAAFVPGVLAEELNATQISDGAGGQMPLVRETRVLNTTTTPLNAEPKIAFNPMLITLPVGLLCGAVLAALVRYWQIGFKVGATLWELFALFGSLLLPGMIFVTRHWAVAWNENLLQFTPLALLVVLAIWSRRLRPWLAWAAAAALGLSLLGTLVTISHLTPQANAPGICLALPLHAAVYYGARQLQHRDATRTEAAASRVPLPGTTS